MQGPDWTPNAEQWKKIRAKFDQVDSLPIYDIALKAAQDAARLASGYVPPPAFNSAPVTFPVPGASSFDSASIAVPIPTQPATISAPPVGPRIHTTMPPPAFQTSKTADIDTSGGMYRSPFEA